MIADFFKMKNTSTTAQSRFLLSESRPIASQELRIET